MKGNCRIVNFAVRADLKIKRKENEKRDGYSDLAEEQKKTMENQADGNTDFN